MLVFHATRWTRVTSSLITPNFHHKKSRDLRVSTLDIATRSKVALPVLYLLDKCHTWDISSMWPNEWTLTISRSLWPIFHASVILPFIFITISWRIVIPGLLYLCDKMIYIQIHLGQCDLYYMVEWFRHITWKLFHRLFHFDFLNDKNVTI